MTKLLRFWMLNYYEGHRRTKWVSEPRSWGRESWSMVGFNVPCTDRARSHVSRVCVMRGTAWGSPPSDAMVGLKTPPLSPLDVALTNSLGFWCSGWHATQPSLSSSHGQIIVVRVVRPTLKSRESCSLLQANAPHDQVNNAFQWLLSFYSGSLQWYGIGSGFLLLAWSMGVARVPQQVHHP